MFFRYQLTKCFHKNILEEIVITLLPRDFILLKCTGCLTKGGKTMQQLLTKAKGNQDMLTVHPLLATATAQRKTPPAGLQPDDMRLHYKLPASRENQTGLPAPLIQKAEQLGGVPLDDVRVHYRSSEPDRLGALAFAQGTHIFLAPQQESHIGHELRHVVQQKKGLVQPQFTLLGQPINASPSLERDADAWDALLSPLMSSAPRLSSVNHQSAAATVQRFAVIQCDWRDFVKSTFWSMLNALLLALQTAIRACSSGGENFEVEAGFSLAGLATDITNLIGAILRIGQDRSMPDSAKVGMIISVITSLLSNLVSTLAGFIGASTPDSAFVKQVNTWGSSASALVSGGAGLYTIGRMLVQNTRTDGSTARAQIDFFAVAIDAISQLVSLFQGGPQGMLTALILEIIVRILRLLGTWFDFSLFHIDKPDPDSSGGGSGSGDSDEASGIALADLSSASV